MQRLLLNALRITQSIGIWNQLRPRSQYVGERSHDLNRSASGKREYPLQRPCRLKVCGDRRDYQWTDCRLRRLPGCILRHVLIGALGKRQERRVLNCCHVSSGHKKKTAEAGWV